MDFENIKVFNQIFNEVYSIYSCIMYILYTIHTSILLLFYCIHYCFNTLYICNGYAYSLFVYLPTAVPIDFQYLGTVTSDHMLWWIGLAVWVLPKWQAWRKNWMQRTGRTRHRWRLVTKSYWWTKAWWHSKFHSPLDRSHTPWSRSSTDNHQPSRVISKINTFNVYIRWS